MRILVVGGTGTVGRPTVAELVHRGHEVRVLSRSGRTPVRGAVPLRGDVTTGEGLDAAMDGVDAVVDATDIDSLNGRRAAAFFVGGTRRLLAAERAAGVAHHVLLSIVGVDRVPTGYYRAKRAQEEVLETAGPVPGWGWSVLRSTQFHDFPRQLLAAARVGPLVLAPRMVVQPVSTSDVAAALADAVEAGPGGRLPVLAGPAVLELADMVRAVQRVTGAPGRIVLLPALGTAGRRARDGGLLPAPGERVRTGSRTFEAYLADLAGEAPFARHP